MTARRIFDEKTGNCQILIAEKDGTYSGVVLKDGRLDISLDGEELGPLKAALRNHAGKLHPDYFGMAGAKTRFLEFFPEGFADSRYKRMERDYKEQAREALTNAAPLEAALEADAGIAAACKKGTRTNLLSRFEAARLNELLVSDDGPAFVRAAAAFTRTPNQSDLHRMAKAIAPHGHASWPLVTYFPYLWDPARHMFLKPNATVDFASRTGKAFASDYDPSLDIEVYDALLDLAVETEVEIADMRPVDRIDIQSFIWVVGSYTDADRA